MAGELKRTKNIAQHSPVNFESLIILFFLIIDMANRLFHARVSRLKYAKKCNPMYSISRDQILSQEKYIKLAVSVPDLAPVIHASWGG
jgi:hypothetical protein